MENRSIYIFTALQIAAFGAVLWLVFSWPGWDLRRCIGTGLMIAGLGGIATARYQLGKSFYIKAEARARREARVLEAALGGAYREYRRKTWF